MSEEQLVDETDNNSIHSTLVAKKNILIIDDDIEFTMAIARTLQDLYKVDIANTLKVAAQKLTLKEFPVILLDYDFGEEINGINFSNYIKQLYPLSHVIMATGYLDYDIAKEALNNGSVNYFMTKPIDTEKLISMIESGLGRHSENKQLMTFLDTPSGVKDAKSFIGNILDNEFYEKSQGIDVIGIIISRGSIPVYSKFYSEGIFQNISNTLFAGFMNALVIVGNELFDNPDNVANTLEAVNFSGVTISFKVIDEFQITLILDLKNQEDKDIRVVLNLFYSRLADRIEANSEFYERNLTNNDEIEELLQGLQNKLNDEHL